jgi:glycosyltransferase involved in cell wall biosynthesis
MRIGFACLWDAEPSRTWSRTPWQLRAAMRRQADIVDVGVELSRAMRTSLTAIHLRLRDGRPSSVWEQSRLTDAYCQRVIARNAQANGCDAVLEIQDLAPLDVPYFVYQDMSFDALIGLVDEGRPVFREMDVTKLQQRRERQLRVYERAAGVLAMSHWLARSLVERTGLAPEKVHVVHPGLHADGSVDGAAEIAERPGPRRRLLFVGRTWGSKGGDLVLDAVRILRREVDPAITVTVVGPPTWPVAGEVPDGVNFVGGLPLAEVAALYDTHDLFVLPTKIEGFGIVFAEALARGLPCVGRDAFAMPEMIQPGVNGALLREDDPTELAGLIAATLADDGIYETCRARAGEVARWFSWERAAQQAIEAISATAVSPPVLG